MRRFRSFLLFLLIVWALGEILTRVFIPLDPEKRTIDRTFDHPYIRTDWVPGFETTYVIEGIGGQKGKMEFDINQFGFRSRSMETAQKPPGTYRIFFLGGSTTEQIYLPEEKTFPALVEKKLSKVFLGTRFECINNGISGYLAADVLALLIYKVMYFEPDLVTVMLGINDLRYGAAPFFDPVRRPGYRKVLYTPGVQEGISKSLMRMFKRSHFLTLIKWRLINRIFPPEAEKYKTKLEEYNAWRKARHETPVSPVSESRALEDFLKFLKEIIFVAQGHGVRLILMTEPFIYQDPLPPEIDEKLWMGYLPELGLNLSTEFLHREIRRFNEAVRGLSREYGVELIDLEKKIPKDLDHFYDDVHLTPQGSERASEVIVSYLAAYPEKLARP